MYKNIILFISIFSILATSTVASASRILDAETAAKIDAQIMVRPNGNKLFSDGKIYEVFINENNEVDFKESDSNEKTSSTTSTNQSYHNDECIKMKNDEDKLPGNANLVCNNGKDYLMAVYKDEHEEIIRIVGRNKDDKEFKIIKEIAGKAIISIKKAHYKDSARYFAFAVAEDSGYRETGKAIIIIDKESGAIMEHNQPFSLKAKPVIGGYGLDIYFVGIDQNVYKITEYGSDYGRYYGSNSSPAVSPVWINRTGFEITKIFSMYSQHSFIKLRDSDHGKDIYKFFEDGNFGCELSTEYDIIDLEYVDSSNILDKSDKSYGNIIALVTKGDGYLPPKIYLVRWYKSSDYKPNKRFEVSQVIDSSNVDNKIINTWANHFSELGLNDKGIDVREWFREKECGMRGIGDTKIQAKLFRDLSADSKDVEFVEPYFTTIKNAKDDISIPVNVWPAKGASIADPKPIIIYVHGGPGLHVDVTSPDKYARNQYLASQGYWVVCPEPRGSSGYGDEHKLALVNNWGKNHIDDIIAVADAFKNRPDVDSNNVFLMGYSFGGYTTLSTSTRTDVANYFDGYVSISGVSDVGKLLSEVSEMKRLEGKQKYLDVWYDRIGSEVYTNHSINHRNIEVSPIYR